MVFLPLKTVRLPDAPGRLYDEWLAELEARLPSRMPTGTGSAGTPSFR